MIRTLVGIGVASAAMLGFAGCSPASSGTLPALSVTDKPANAAVIAELVERLCVEGMISPDAFPERLGQTGWTNKRIQQADDGTTLDVWKLPHIELVHSGVPTETRTAKVWTCMVAVDAEAAPSIAQLEAVLRPKTDRKISDIRAADWQWKPSSLTQAHITINRNMVGGQSIFVEFADLKPFNALFGS